MKLFVCGFDETTPLSRLVAHFERCGTILWFSMKRGEKRRYAIIEMYDGDGSSRTRILGTAGKARVVTFLSAKGGNMRQPANIVASMRSGAREYIDRSAGYEALLEALTRFSSLRTRALGSASRGRVFTFRARRAAGDGGSEHRARSARQIQIARDFRRLNARSDSGRHS